MPNAFISTVRIMRSFVQRGSAERVRAMRKHVEADPRGNLAPWMAAIALWEEGEIEEAHRLAEAILEEQPSSFRMLVICLDWSIRSGDSERTLALAQRVVQAENSSTLLRWSGALLSVLDWPLRLLGRGSPGRRLRREADVLDKWVHWAKHCIESSARPPHAT
jgi:hypothetical protein